MGYLVVKTDAGVVNRHLARLDPTRRRRSDLPAGFPDLIVLHPTRPAFFVEVKAKHGRLSPAQERVHQWLRQLGFEVLVVRGQAEAEALIDRFWEERRAALHSG